MAKSPEFKNAEYVAVPLPDLETPSTSCLTVATAIDDDNKEDATFAEVLAIEAPPKSTVLSTEIRVLMGVLAVPYIVIGGGVFLIMLYNPLLFAFDSVGVSKSHECILSSLMGFPISLICGIVLAFSALRDAAPCNRTNARVVLGLPRRIMHVVAAALLPVVYALLAPPLACNVLFPGKRNF